MQLHLAQRVTRVRPSLCVLRTSCTTCGTLGICSAAEQAEGGTGAAPAILVEFLCLVFAQCRSCTSCNSSSVRFAYRRIFGVPQGKMLIAQLLACVPCTWCRDFSAVSLPLKHRACRTVMYRCCISCLQDLVHHGIPSWPKERTD